MDYSEVPLERILQSLDLMKRARAALIGETPVDADIVLNLPPMGTNECPLPALVAPPPENADIEPAPLCPIPIENDERVKSPVPEKNWKNWNE